MKRHYYCLIAFLSLFPFFQYLPASAQGAAEQVITLNTSRTIGDSVRIKVVSQNAAPVSVEGLSESTLAQDYKKYQIKSQTIVVRGPVLFLATFSNGITQIVFKNASVLDRIDCEQNELTDLDFTEAPNLRQLFCHKNKIERINVEACTQLQWFNCSENRLKSLNVSNNASLNILVCADNKLNALDTKRLTSLQTLDCARNMLNTLDLTANHSLRGLACQNNLLTDLRLTGCERLETIVASANKLTQLDLSGLSKLKDLRCYENAIERLSFAESPLVKTIYLECNSIKERDMTDLMRSLPIAEENAKKGAKIGVLDLTSSKEKNVCNKEAVDIATKKHWSVLAFDGRKYIPYEGSGSASLEVPDNNEKPLVYPTEVTDRLYLSQAFSKSGFPTVIYSMEGRKILRLKDGEVSSVDVSELPQGMYIVVSGSLSAGFIKR